MNVTVEKEVIGGRRVQVKLESSDAERVRILSYKVKTEEGGRFMRRKGEEGREVEFASLELQESYEELFGGAP